MQPPTLDQQIGHYKPKTTFKQKDIITTETGSLYRSVTWPVPSPYETDTTKVLQKPNDINHCLKECDYKADKCLAVVSLNDQESNQLVKCYFVNGKEYYTDLDKQKSSTILVKVSWFEFFLRPKKLINFCR